MRGDSHDVDSEIVLPAGMELVVPPVAGPTSPAAADRGEAEHEASCDTHALSADDASREGRRRRPAA
ncbi:MAG TPA: hypothetical protein VFG57_08410 [Gaiella sp.]|jgi:hypothetical protein|nr:hypothetical protein [Gaiella sp.]